MKQVGSSKTTLQTGRCLTMKIVVAVCCKGRPSCRRNALNSRLSAHILQFERSLYLSVSAGWVWVYNGVWSAWECVYITVDKIAVYDYKSSRQVANLVG